MPTTSAIAGTVSGMRQMNSMTRLRTGNRKRTHTNVGRSRTSMAMVVIAASSSDAVMASASSGVLTMFCQASRLRGAVSELPRVENSNMDAIGMRKNAPMTMKTAARNSCSLLLRWRLTYSPQPVGGSSLENRVQGHDEEHDQDHRQRQGLGEAGLCAARFARQQVRDLQRQDHAALRDQGRRGRVGGERVREEKERAAKEGGREKRTRDVAPVVPRAATEALRRLAPLRPDPVHGGQEHDPHQRDLEV